MTQRTARCQPWCTDHDDCTLNGLIHANPEDAICQTSATSAAYGEILVSHSNRGTTIALYGVRDELTPADAEQLAYTLLALAAQTRIAVAA